MLLSSFRVEVSRSLVFWATESKMKTSSLLRSLGTAWSIVGTRPCSIGGRSCTRRSLGRTWRRRQRPFLSSSVTGSPCRGSWAHAVVPSPSRSWPRSAAPAVMPKTSKAPPTFSTGPGAAAPVRPRKAEPAKAAQPPPQPLAPPSPHPAPPDDQATWASGGRPDDVLVHVGCVSVTILACIIFFLASESLLFA